MNENEFFSTLFSVEDTKKKPAKGKMLLSEPFTNDMYFSRSAVILAEYAEDGGALGFTLTNPVSPEDLLLSLVDDLEGLSPSIYYGGPVGQSQMYYLHPLPPEELEGSIKIMDGLYWGGVYEELIDKIKTGHVPIDKVKFFIGYSGWAPGQLENELKYRYWLIADTNADEVLGETDNLWKRKLKSLGPRYALWTSYPRDPMYN